MLDPCIHYIFYDVLLFYLGFAGNHFSSLATWGRCNGPGSYSKNKTMMMGILTGASGSSDGVALLG